jgi:hypothetical protein
MDAAGRSPDRDHGATAVRHDRAVAERVTPPVFHPIALALLAITAGLLWRRAATNEN